MLVVECKEHYEEVLKFAKESGQLDLFEKKIKFLRDYGTEAMRCHLMYDSAPHSFYFRMEVCRKGEWCLLFNGGLIYHGQHDNGGDGGAPTFSVCLEPISGWSVHT